ncbi:putative ribonuclease H-like domain-containing protein [Tanacetum coccineum]
MNSFKLLDENQVVLRAPRQNGVYSLDLKNIVPSGGITCLYANATTDESKLWHRRLGHVNFKNINKLVKGHLVRGLPSKVFVNDHTCVACKKGKQHKASCKAKLERTIRKPLELLHMDLFGPVSVESINKKKYCLVVTDDFSRFSWVFFLATKDETNEILYKFITGLENQLNHKVKIIRSDHGTEFKNHAMNEFCAKKGIKREFSVARTPQQNGVAERKNRTLIEAARTMLADSLLPIPFWAEAVNTACYVLNRVLVTKPQNKTPYELLIGKPPSISFMRPFGCPLTILNTLDPLGKFDGKSDEGYLLGYSTTSKAFRVYNKRTKRVEENMHIDFLEDQPNVARSGPDWMFDLDFLTNTMNYIPISVENQVNVDAGTQKHYVAGSSKKDKEPTQEYILLPLHPHRPRISVEDVVRAAQEKPSEDFPKDSDVQDSEDVVAKEEQHILTKADQALKDDLERMIAQEITAKAMYDATRQAFEEEKKRTTQATSINKLNTGRPSVSASNSPLVSTADTPYASAASTPTGANTGGSSFVYLGGQIPIDASTLPNTDLPIDPNMPDLEDEILLLLKSTYKRRIRSANKSKDIGIGMDLFSAAKERLNSAKVEVNTEVNPGSIGVNTGNTPVSTPSVIQTVNVIVPSPVKSQREGKAPMTSKDVQATQKIKEHIRQEEAGLAEAMRLQALQDEEDARQVHLDALLAKRIQEVQELSKQQQKRKAEVQEASQFYTKEDWDTIRAKLEANAELTKSLQGENMSSDDLATRMLKKLTFEELKVKFEKLMRSIESFVLMRSEERVKRVGVQLEQESLKKHKITIEDVPVTEEKVEVVKKEKSIKRIGKRKKQKARKGTHADKTAKHEAKEDMEVLVKGNDTDSSSGTDIPVSAVLVAIKPPSIANWKIIKLGNKGVYQIIREDGTYITYINFGAMLKSISRDDLTELYRLVMQKYGTNGPEDKYERVFWGDLKTMFDPPLTDIYMLTERRYPIPADVCQAMLDKKLQGDKKDEA